MQELTQEKLDQIAATNIESKWDFISAMNYRYTLEQAREFNLWASDRYPHLASRLWRV